MHLTPLLMISIAILLLGGLLWYLLRDRSTATAGEDPYTRGLELWLAGDRINAVESMRKAVNRSPGAVDPYLQLGDFLRQTGDPGRAAALHRGLAARSSLTRFQRFATSLSLAEDLIELERWDEARVLLDGLTREKPTTSRFWHARFRQWLGSNDHEAAAKTLQDAAKRTEGEDRTLFSQRLQLFQLDRALELVRTGRPGHAQRLLRGIKSDGAGKARIHLIDALILIADQDYEKAAEVASTGLLESPGQSTILLPVLQRALLESGHFERTIPILESACQSEHAPANLWIALALLYEKIGDREMAIRLIESKTGDKRLTLQTAAPFLRLLVYDLPECDFTRLWSSLNLGLEPADWQCRHCGTVYDELRWFCPSCQAFDSILAGEFHPVADS